MSIQLFVLLVKTGIIRIQSSFNKALPLSEVDEILQNATKPAIHVVKDYLEQSGYKISEFNGIDQTNVNIIDLEYGVHIPITKPFHLNELSPCISRIFNVIHDNIHEGIVMRFEACIEL